MVFSWVWSRFRSLAASLIAYISAWFMVVISPNLSFYLQYQIQALNFIFQHTITYLYLEVISSFFDSFEVSSKTK